MNAQSLNIQACFRTLFVGFILTCLTTLPGRIKAEDRFLIISGGGTATSNNYSQYLQTRTLAGALRAQHGAADVFFGAGNHEKTLKPSTDVHVLRRVYGGTGYNEFIPGIIRGNRPAVKDGIRNWFDTSRPGAPQRGDVLFLFVSDHGVPYRGDSSYQNNCILLWYQGTRRPWSYRCLSRRELQAWLGALPVKRTVFAMSQCYSGGFHQMSVQNRGGYPTANPAVCGFTSTTPDRIASGCTPDVDGPGYQGYERYFTEQLTGVNVVSGKQDFTPAAGVREAHRRAVLLDFTLDIPLSTTDYYLNEWSRLLDEEGFRPRTSRLGARQIRRIFREAASLTMPPERLFQLAGKLGPQARARYAFLQRMTRAVAERNAGLSTVLYSGTREDLKSEIASLLSRADKIARVRNRLHSRRGQLRRNHFFQDWRDAVDQGQAGLAEETSAFEKQVFARFETRHGHRNNFEAQMKYMFLRRLLGVTGRDRAKARRFSIYFNNRDRSMYTWALNGNDPDLMRSARNLRSLDARIRKESEKAWALRELAGLTRRLLFMRNQFGALVALGAMADTDAAGDLRGLDQCERTPYAKSIKINSTRAR